ncbi:MAG: (Fe-S)-binding protein, partial [Candidatus Sumerlaeaceae bacterium]|nr:(Fe-S)-binding protein [Candidatus Sumerlaeaceae bacterium]
GLAFVKAGGNATLALARLASAIGYKLTAGALARLPANMPLPKPAPPLPRTGAGESDTLQEVVYYPSCLTRMLGALPGEHAPVGLAEAVVTTLKQCGWNAVIPTGVGGTCCGQPFYSKGFYEAQRESARRTFALLWEASQGGKLPIVTDASPCGGELNNYGKLLSGADAANWRRLKIHDFSAFMARVVLPKRTDWPKTERRIVLHPTCTLMKRGELADFKRVASTFAGEVVVPVMVECCGFAGDKGFSLPELTRSATQHEAREVQSCGADGHYSTCRTCEIGLTAATGQVYQSIVYLCYEALVTSRA